MRVLITGGSGFLGAWLIRRLTRQHIGVRVFDVRPDAQLARSIAGAVAEAVEWHSGDVADGGAVEQAAQDCDAIIHLAGVLTPACQADPVRGAQINLIGTLNVFEAARRQGMRHVLYASSAGVYGPHDGQVPWPVTHYGAFKLACEGCARAYWHDHRLASTGFRPFVVYGPGRESGVSAGPSLACRAAARNESFVIPFTGATGLVFVDDVAAAYEAALHQPADGARVFNLAGERATVDDVIQAIMAYMPEARLHAQGVPLPINADIAADTLTQYLPGLPHTPLAEGLRATIDFYRAAGATAVA